MNHYEIAGKKHFVSLKLECQSVVQTRIPRLSKQALHNGPRPLLAKPLAILE